jgi:hypothetical protein
MAKAILTIEDGPETGGVTIGLEFDPMLKTDDVPTTAQWLGFKLLEKVTEVKRENESGEEPG